MTLLDSWMPQSDAAAAYGITIAAPIGIAYEALLATDFGSHPLVALLMGVRAIPALLVAPRATWRRMMESRNRGSLRLKAPLGQDFALLEEAPPTELVMGLTGRFWTPSGGLIATDAGSFRELPPAGMARAAWNFLFEPLDGGRTRLTTETRVRCSDSETTRRFLRYWRLVSPGSAVIRWAILRQIRHRAERRIA